MVRQDITFSGAEHVDFTVEVTDWDCYVHVYASIYNTTGGNNSHVYSQSYHLDNPGCYQASMDLTDESGDYISYSDIEAGTTDLIWRVSFDEDNLPVGHEFELTSTTSQTGTGTRESMDRSRGPNPMKARPRSNGTYR